MSASPSPDISLLGKIAEYTEIIARDPQSTAFVPLADTYRRLGMLDEAWEVAEQGVKTLPRFAPGFVMLGRIRLERKDAEGAAVSLQNALALDPANLAALHGLARILIGKGEKGRARELLQQGLRRHPDDAGLRQLFASLAPPAAAAGARPPATAAAEGAPIATPTIAEIYLKQGLPQRALKVYRDLLVANPADEALRRKIRELEAALVADATKPAADATTTPSASPAVAPQRAPESSQSRYLQLLDRWLVAVRERKTDVR